MMDKPTAFLRAYYNGGVQALDVRGALATTDTQKDVNVSQPHAVKPRSHGRRMATGLCRAFVYVWGQYLSGRSMRRTCSTGSAVRGR